MQCLLLTPTALRNLSMRLASLRGTEFGSLLSTNKKIPTEHLQRLCGHDSIDRCRSHQSQALTWLAQAQSRLETGAGGAQHGRLWLPLGQGPGTYPALRTCLVSTSLRLRPGKAPCPWLPDTSEIGTSSCLCSHGWHSAEQNKSQDSKRPAWHTLPVRSSPTPEPGGGPQRVLPQLAKHLGPRWALCPELSELRNDSL